MTVIGRDGVLVHNCEWIKITKEMASTVEKMKVMTHFKIRLIKL